MKTELPESVVLDLVDSLCVAVSAALAEKIKIVEAIGGDGATVTMQQRLDAMKTDLATERAKIAAQQEKLRDARRAASRKRELERIRNAGERPANKDAQIEGQGSQRTIQLLDGHGKLIGRIQQTGTNKFQILDSKGAVVAREIDGRTYTARGVYAGTGRQGLRLLGQMMAAKQA